MTDGKLKQQEKPSKPNFFVNNVRDYPRETLMTIGNNKQVIAWFIRAIIAIILYLLLKALINKFR